MKNAKGMLLGAVLAVASLAGAQTVPEIRAQVPFDFTIGKTMIPAGECQIISLNPHKFILLIRNMEAMAGIPSMYLRDDSGKADQTTLVFHRYGKRYFLSAIRVEGNSWTYRLPESGAEAELRAQRAPASTTTVLAAVRQ